MGIIEKGVAKVTQSVANATDILGDLVSSKRQFIIKQITNAILLIVILLVFGCFDFLHLKFHYEYLIDGNYWVSIAIKTVADICAYNIGVNFIIDDVIKRNQTLTTLKKQYDELNEVKQEDFPEFIREYNQKQKIVAWKGYINRKIYTLNKHSKRMDRVNYLSNPESTSTRYFNKRTALERMKTDNFINKNIDSLEAPYKDIDVAVFELEINGTEKIVQNKVTGSLAKGRAIASVSTMLGVVAFSVIFTPIGLQPNKEEFEEQMVAAVNTAVRIASDIGIVVWQFTRGILGTPRIVSSQLTVPLAERVKILKQYYAWRRANGKSVPKCYLDLLTEKSINEPKSEKPKDEVEIELTQEQYNKLFGNQENKEL